MRPFTANFAMGSILQRLLIFGAAFCVSFAARADYSAETLSEAEISRRQIDCASPLVICGREKDGRRLVIQLPQMLTVDQVVVAIPDLYIDDVQARLTAIDRTTIDQRFYRVRKTVHRWLIEKLGGQAPRRALINFLKTLDAALFYANQGISSGRSALQFNFLISASAGLTVSPRAIGTRASENLASFLEQMSPYVNAVIQSIEPSSFFDPNMGLLPAGAGAAVKLGLGVVIIPRGDAQTPARMELRLVGTFGGMGRPFASPVGWVLGSGITLGVLAGPASREPWEISEGITVAPPVLPTKVLLTGESVQIMATLGIGIPRAGYVGPFRMININPARICGWLFGDR